MVIAHWNLTTENDHHQTPQASQIMWQVNISEAKLQLSDLVERALTGEGVIIARDGKPLVKLVSLGSEATAPRTPGSAKGVVVMAPDFDAPLDDFAASR